jgi:hypothetical protein
MKRFTCLIIAILAITVPGFAQEEDPLNPAWNSYHSTDRAHAMLEAWAKAHPQLTELYSIGESLEGTPLMVLEITNKETGPPLEKPGYYYDGNIHAGELTGAEVALHFAWYLLANYGKDPAVTHLVDTRTLYVRPKFNPDGADVALTTIHGPRSTPRPYDEDADGLLDEDPPNDLDNDGVATTMRVPNPHGVWKKSSEDPRIMVRRKQGEVDGEYYDVYSEGIDDDGDGAFNEDGVGGIDMNRNFPRNWGMEYQQSGAGPYPLSEPETRTTIEFINSHRNITGIYHGHTSGGFLFRLPSTTSWDNYSMADQRFIIELTDKYAETTGQPVRPSYSNPRLHRHGTLISWGYWDFGVVGHVPEFWGGFGKDYNGDGNVSEAEQHRFNEEEIGGKGFTNWAPYDHPQLGKVEIGGWNRQFTRQNPPEKFLKGEVELYVPWMLWLAQVSPRVVILDATLHPTDVKDVYKVTLEIENEGYLPTNITERALENETAVPVRGMIKLQNAELLGGKERIDLGHLKGSRDTTRTEGRHESRRTVEYVVRKRGGDSSVTLIVVSEKGGTARRTLELR